MCIYIYVSVRMFIYESIGLSACLPACLSEANDFLLLLLFSKLPPRRGQALLANHDYELHTIPNIHIKIWP